MEVKIVEIINIEMISEDIKIFTLNHRFDYSTAGGYVLISNDGIKPKPFSISSGDGDILKLMIKKVGNFTKILFDKKVGDTIYLANKVYRTKFPNKLDESTCLISMGVGLAPMLSYENDDNYANSIHIHSCRYEHEIIDFNIPSHTYCTRTIKDNTELVSFGRRIDIDKIGEYGSYLVCGSKAFAESTKKALIEKYPNATIYTEGFGG